MSVQGSELKSALLIAALVALYAVAALCAWFLGPALGVGAAGRVVLVTLILLTWPLAVLFKHYRTSRAAEGGGAAPAGKERSGSRRPAQLPPPAGTYEE